MAFCKWSIFLGALITAAACGHVRADPTIPLVLSWDCVQESDDRFHVRCVPRLLNTEPSAPVAFDYPLQERPGELVRARDLRPVAHRSEAEVFSVPAWRVPLYAPPLDDSFVIVLLRSVLCGKAAGCEVNYVLPEVRATRLGPKGRFSFFR